MKGRLLIVVITLFAVMLLPTGAGAGPHRLPDAACNQGTQNAHDVGANGSERIAHQHDFDADGTSGCYHFNAVKFEFGE